MSEMVERVARAMYDAQEELLKVYSLPWDVSPHQEVFRFQARAAIEVMREPTEKMMHAGVMMLAILAAANRLESAIEDAYSGERASDLVWAGMIDEALK